MKAKILMLRVMCVGLLVWCCFLTYVIYTDRLNHLPQPLRAEDMVNP